MSAALLSLLCFFGSSNGFAQQQGKDACHVYVVDVAKSKRAFETVPRTVGPSTILVDAYGHSPEGVPVNVTIHAREGEISELEVISKDATEVFGMPTPETLQIV